MITNIPESLNNVKISLGFDLDSTLIKTKSGRRFPKDKDDWIGYDEVINNIKTDAIIIFTNQAGKISNEDLIYKLDGISHYIRTKNDKVFRVYYMASRGYTVYRKPHIGMYLSAKRLLTDDFLYVGDAAGRTYDFSSSDRAFAHNCRVRFQTPEEFLGGPAEDFKWEYEPKPIVGKKNDIVSVEDNTMYILIGCPGSGKSTFAQEYFKDYAICYINRDTLKTRKKCLDVAKQCTESIIIIDNTNPSLVDRKSYIEIAREKNMKVYTIWFNIDRDVCQYLTFLRADRYISKIVYNIYFKKFVEPTKEEFDKIFKMEYIDIPDLTYRQ